MEINITPATRRIWQETLDQLGGQARRLFMASVVTKTTVPIGKPWRQEA